MQLTPEFIASLIVDEHYLEAAPKQTVVAVLKLENGQVVIGESHCLDPERFVAEVGARNARADAVRKIWAMAGYAVREAVHQRDKRQEREALGEALAFLQEDAKRIILPH